MNEVRGMKTVLIEGFHQWFIDHTSFLATNSRLIHPCLQPGNIGDNGIISGDNVGGRWGKSAQLLVERYSARPRENILPAPLKPHQGMAIQHEVVLVPVSNGWLCWLNTTLTANVRQWLKLELLPC
jgi:hypothetical protein